MPGEKAQHISDIHKARNAIWIPIIQKRHKPKQPVLDIRLRAFTIAYNACAITHRKSMLRMKLVK